MDYDICVKTILIGDSSVGKSSLLYRYTDNDWNPYYIATIGVDFKVLTFERAGKVVKLQLWDTAGQERFRSITQSYYKGANSVLLVFDVADRESYENVRGWLRDIRTFGTDGVPVVLIGNKADLPADKRQVSTEEATALAAELGFPYFETSARTGDNVLAAFEKSVDASLEQRNNITLAARSRKGVRLPDNNGGANPAPKSRCLCG